MDVVEGYMDVKRLTELGGTNLDISWIKLNVWPSWTEGQLKDFIYYFLVVGILLPISHNLFLGLWERESVSLHEGLQMSTYWCSMTGSDKSGCSQVFEDKVVSLLCISARKCWTILLNVNSIIDHPRDSHVCKKYE